MFFLRRKCIFSFFLFIFIHAETSPKIGLVLSGGGSKGFAHVATLKALDSLNISIDYIAGTSFGAIVGAMYALGYSGNGVALSPYLGHKAALQSLGQEKGKTAFSKTKFERRFYYFGRPWFLKFASYRYRIKDYFENKKRTIV